MKNILNFKNILFGKNRKLTPNIVHTFKKKTETYVEDKITIVNNNK